MPIRGEHVHSHFTSALSSSYDIRTVGIVFIALLLLFFLIFAAYVALHGGFTFPWLAFYVRGKEVGFAWRDISLLQSLAVTNGVPNPEALFWSVALLDRCIRAAIVGAQEDDRTDGRHVSFILRVFAYRTGVELNQPSRRLGINSTRGITVGQTVKMISPNGAAYVATLMENNRRALILTQPRGPLDLAPSAWRGRPVKFYFWRRDDAGYYFESHVNSDAILRQVPVLLVRHVDSLVRTQKRRSVRRGVEAPAQLFALRSSRSANEQWERSRQGSRVFLLDISEEGLSVVVKGRAKPGGYVKVQIALYGAHVVVCGEVKSCRYDSARNSSALHIEALPPSPVMRVRILSFVYRLFDRAIPESPEREASPEPDRDPVGIE